MRYPEYIWQRNTSRSWLKNALLTKAPLTTARALVAGMVLLLSGPVFSLPGDSQQPINIQSDRAAQKVLEDGSEKTEYFGSVVMTQGSMSINGEHITIYSKDRQVTKIIAIGKPAQFQQQSDPSKAPMKASADNINYQLSSDTVILANNAMIEQDGNTVSGKRIEYNIASERVNANRGEDNTSRVHMVLKPVKKTKE